MSKNELQKVKAFYAKQGECPSIKWTRDANRVQRAVCTRKEMQEELASIIFAPKLIVTNNRKLNWYDKDNRSKTQ